MTGRYRTLARGGVTRSFRTYDAAYESARTQVAETGEWVGVEQYESSDWWLIDCVDPVSPTPGDINAT